MDNRTLLKTGIIGAVLTGLCCVTPVLVILLGAIGLSAWVGWLDVVLIPALAGFVGLAAYALWRRRAAAACCAVPLQSHAGNGNAP